MRDPNCAAALRIRGSTSVHQFTLRLSFGGVSIVLDHTDFGIVWNKKCECVLLDWTPVNGNLTACQSDDPLVSIGVSQNVEAHSSL